jgi:hypothetical protein
MMQDATSSHGTPAAIPVDLTAFAAFGMREVNGETIDAAIAAAGDALVCVFFWGEDCFNGVPVFVFFHRGTKLGRATGWHGHAQFAAAVANARNKLAGKPLV